MINKVEKAMVFLSASKVMVGDTKKNNSIEIRGPLVSTKEHQYEKNILIGRPNIYQFGIYVVFTF